MNLWGLVIPLLLLAILVRNLSVRLGKRIEWDAASMKAKNAPEADALIRPEYRKGWSLEVRATSEEGSGLATTRVLGLQTIRAVSSDSTFRYAL